MKKGNFLLIFSAACFLILFNSCQSSSTGSNASPEEWTSKRAGSNEVVVHELSDPDKLNPITSQAAGATYVKYNIFMYLLDADKENLTLNPSLAKERPRITEITEGEYAGGLAIEYELRPEAVWDNGEPVTAHDVVFTFKAVKNPLVDCEHLRPYLDFIDHIEVDRENPKKFTMFSKGPFFAAESSSGFQAFITPEYLYDPKGLMKDFTVKELNDPAMRDKLRGDAKLNEFANDFNSEKFQREAGFVVGCGPYEFVSWTTGQRIILRKKENWWGDQLAGKVPNFSALPDKIVYEIINDRTTTLSAMKDESLDISRALREKDFVDQMKNERFQEMYHLFTPTSLSYTYIGLNMKRPGLSELNVRKALAHTINRQQIMDVLLYGLAGPIATPLHPSMKFYNHDITNYDYDLAKAQQLLDEAGWKDTDGDGIRDKIVNGQKTKLSFVFKYNAGNDTREKIGLFFKENAKKIGVDLEILAREWTVFLDETKSHDFDIFCGGWIQDPFENDPKQIWHTQSYNGGSNYVGFGNEKTDAVIDSLRKEMNEKKIRALYMQFQQDVHDQVPYIFLYTPRERIAMSKRLTNAKAYTARPGYTERELQTATPGNSASAE